MTDRSSPPEEQPVEVPWAELAPDTLRHVLEEVVTRDGTDYGAREHTLEEKADALMAALRRGDAKLVYEAESGTISVASVHDAR